MSTISMLSEAAIVQATRPISTRNLHRLHRALEGPVEISPAYPDILIDLHNFDWKDKGYGRNWWWSMQQLPSLTWSCGDIRALEDELVCRVKCLNKKLIESWSRACRPSYSTVPLAWHDHAGALRAINMFRWMNTLLANGWEGEDSEGLEQLVLEHAHWLADPKNYSKGNNHGFEQAWILLEITVDWPEHGQMQGLSALASMRLSTEIKNAFTAQGVHRENSPGYQYFMVKRLRELKKFLYDRRTFIEGIDVDALIEQGDEFLSALSQKDGRLPLIGDTQEKPRQQQYISNLLYSKKSEMDKSFDYCDSGYFIWKSHANAHRPAIQLVMKNAHESSFHRHDDDLMIHLTIGEKTLFGDGGLYAHDKDCRIRKYLRTGHAHSTVFPLTGKAPHRDPKKVRRSPHLQFDPKSQVVSGKTYAFKSIIVGRRCKLVDRKGRLLRISDSVINHCSTPVDMMTTFLLGEGIVAEVVESQSGKSIRFYSEDWNAQLDVVAGEAQSITTSSGWSDDPEKCAIVSRAMLRQSEVQRAMVYWHAAPAGKSSIGFLISIENGKG